MAAPGARTLRTAAAALIAGMQDGSVLDRSGTRYKPSTCRGYEQALRAHVLPALGDQQLTRIERRDVQRLVEQLRAKQLAPSTIANLLDPLRVIFRRAVQDDEIAVDPTRGLKLPAVRGRRDRIEPPQRAHQLLEALPDTERAFWATALLRASAAVS